MYYIYPSIYLYLGWPTQIIKPQIQSQIIITLEIHCDPVGQIFLFLLRLLMPYWPSFILTFRQACYCVLQEQALVVLYTTE